MSKKRFCTFWVADMFLGVDVARVQEAIIEEQTITQVPLAHEAVEGLMNLRGRIVTAIDLSQRLGLHVGEKKQTPVHVIINSDTHNLISFLVDSLGDVMEIDDKLFEAPPDTLGGEARALVHGAYKLEDHLLFILNVDAAVNVTATL